MNIPMCSPRRGNHATCEKRRTQMKCIVVFTNRGVGLLLEEGGSQAWKLDPDRVRKLTYVVCVQNRNDGDWGRPTHDQGEGFLIGKISGVEMNTEGRNDNRYIIKFDQYAEISVPHMWDKLGGLRNPVRYLDDLENYVDVNALEWKPVQPQNDGEPPRAALPSVPTGIETRALDITEAKKALAAFYRVPVAAIEIVIRG
jgi:hypothetical protein